MSVSANIDMSREVEKEDRKLDSKEIEKKLKNIMAKFSLGKPDEAKFQSFISFLNSDGQGYLLES